MAHNHSPPMAAPCCRLRVVPGCVLHALRGDPRLRHSRIAHRARDDFDDSHLLHEERLESDALRLLNLNPGRSSRTEANRGE